MAKKVLKFLAFSVVISAAVALGIALYKKYTEKDSWDEDFDDFEDDFEDEDLDMDDIKSREYVPITLESPKKEKADEDVNNADEVQENTDTSEDSDYVEE